MYCFLYLLRKRSWGNELKVFWVLWLGVKAGGAMGCSALLSFGSGYALQALHYAALHYASFRGFSRPNASPKDSFPSVSSGRSGGAFSRAGASIRQLLNG